MERVTGTVVEAGEIPVLDGDKKYTYPRAVVVQFDTIEDLKSAITSTKLVRMEWATDQALHTGGSDDSQ